MIRYFESPAVCEVEGFPGLEVRLAISRTLFFGKSLSRREASKRNADIMIIHT